MALHLESPEALPHHLRHRLTPYAAALASTTYWESARNSTDLRAIEAELESHLREQTIQAYHCTRVPKPGFFQRNGLRLTDLKAHQDEFLATQGHRFTEAEKADIRAAWQDYFHKGPRPGAGRNGVIWACMSRPLVVSDGTAPFFEYFGGEAVYWPLRGLPTVAAKLRTIGRPVVVEFAVAGKDFETYQPLAWNVLSQYHQSVNPGASLHLIEARVCRPVMPAEVIRVTPREQFAR